MKLLSNIAQKILGFLKINTFCGWNFWRCLVLFNFSDFFMLSSVEVPLMYIVHCTFTVAMKSNSYSIRIKVHRTNNMFTLSSCFLTHSHDQRNVNHTVAERGSENKENRTLNSVQIVMRRYSFFVPIAVKWVHPHSRCFHIFQCFSNKWSWCLCKYAAILWLVWLSLFYGLTNMFVVCRKQTC